MSAFLEALRERVVIGDGAMGTELMRRRALPFSIPLSGANLAGLNFIEPYLVQDVHRDYCEAGAELHKTNTLTANRLRLGLSSLGEDRVRRINLLGCRLARKWASTACFIAGSVGPLSDLQVARAEARAVYREQIEALAEGGCDLLFLETFTAVDDLLLAVETAKSATVLPVVASMAFARPEEAGEAFVALQKAEADVVGINCVSPKDAISVLESLDEDLRRPLSVFPSLSGTAEIDPDEFARLASQFPRFDVRLIGGCCGTTPAHIKALARRLGR